MSIPGCENHSLSDVFDIAQVIICSMYRHAGKFSSELRQKVCYPQSALSGQSENTGRLLTREILLISPLKRACKFHPDSSEMSVVLPSL